MSPRPKLITPQGGLQEAIITIAWKQIAESGAASLSLRAIARELNITAPAIYNYYSSRDDLVTALIINAYTDFGDAQMAAVQAVPESDLPGRLLASGSAYRAWALAYPERFHLIFGTPIPGYVAPEEKTRPVAARALAALLGVLEGLRAQDRLRLLPAQEIDPEKLAVIEERKKMGGEGDLELLSIAVLIWSRVHGFVALEVSNNLPPYGTSTDTLYQYVLESTVKEFIR
jgi:AcrR family transcriptional regulator